MNTKLKWDIESSNSISQLSASSEAQLINSVIENSRKVMQVNLLGTLFCQTREKEETVLMLSDKDRDYFLNALHNPPKPNQKLKDALNSYKNTFKDE